MSERYIVDVTRYCEKKHGYASVRRDSKDEDFVRCRDFPFGECINPNDDGQGICDLLEKTVWCRSKTLRLRGIVKPPKT